MLIDGKLKKEWQSIVIHLSTLSIDHAGTTDDSNIPVFAITAQGSHNLAE